MEKKYTFGFITNHEKDIFRSSYHSEILAGVLSEAGDKSIGLKIFMVKKWKYKNIEDLMKDERVDGLFGISWRWIHPEFTKLIEKSTGSSAILLFNDYEPKLKVNMVYTDVRAGIKEGVYYLLSKGYKRIGMLRGPSEICFKVGSKVKREPFVDANDKVEGFKKALQTKGISVKKEWIFECKAHHEDEGLRVMKRWLKEKNLPEAIVCSNDDIALGALKAVRESKTKKKIEFVGFDDTEKARLIAPELPTVRQPLYCMGKDSVNILLQKIKKRDKNPVQKAYRPKLIIRNIF